MSTKRRVVVLLCVLVLLGGCVWVYELRFAPYVAEAELMVQPKSDLDLLFDGNTQRCGQRGSSGRRAEHGAADPFARWRLPRLSATSPSRTIRTTVSKR